MYSTHDHQDVMPLKPSRIYYAVTAVAVIGVIMVIISKLQIDKRRLKKYLYMAFAII